MIPAESFLSGTAEEELAREVAGLQQRAEALAREVEARKRAEAHLRATNAEVEAMVRQRTETLRKLSLQIIKLQEVERRRVARELHESVGQDFAGLKMNLDLARRSPQDPKLWENCDRLLEHCINKVRTLSNLLHPPLIEDAGLPSAAAASERFCCGAPGLKPPGPVFFFDLLGSKLFLLLNWPSVTEGSSTGSTACSTA